MSLEKLYREIEKVCPIQDIIVGKRNDKETWIVKYKPEATEIEKSAVQDIISSVDISIINDVIYIPKLIIIDRLEKTGKLELVLNTLSTLDNYKQQRWLNASLIDTKDEDVINLLTTCEINPNDILY